MDNTNCYTNFLKKRFCCRTRFFGLKVPCSFLFFVCLTSDMVSLLLEQLLIVGISRMTFFLLSLSYIFGWIFPPAFAPIQLSLIGSLLLG